MKRFSILFILTLLTLSCSSDKYRLYVVFDNVEGLSEDSKVTSSGLTIGSIEDLKLHENGVLAELEFDNDVRIPEGSLFRIIEPGLISSPVIDVELASNEKNNYKSGDTLNGKLRGHPFFEAKPLPDTLRVEKLHQLIDTLAKLKK